METGRIVEYIDQQKIITAVVTELKNQRLRLLTETNREVNLSANRLSHLGTRKLELGMSRDQLIKSLKDRSETRKALVEKIDILELWDTLKEEDDWIDLETLAGLCFQDGSEDDAQSAVIRAMFADRLYFKFSADKFFPHSEAQVEKLKKQIEEEERKKRIIDGGGSWVKKAATDKKPKVTDEMRPVVEILKEFYIHGDDAPQRATAKKILAKAGMDPGDALFALMVNLGEWDKNENIELVRLGIETEFEKEALAAAACLKEKEADFPCQENRRDLTHLDILTIDGAGTMDFDDALSIEKKGDDLLVGVHIMDVAHYVKRGSELDLSAMGRASSIYLPDARFAMLPPDLSEGICSLIGGELRPAISVLMTISDYSKVTDFEVVATTIKVTRQLTYDQANAMIGEDEALTHLDRIARRFKDQRMANGAISINIPEMNIRVSEKGEPEISRIDRESASRNLVAEFMIKANTIMADFLTENGVPAIFRGQPDPKNRLYKDEGTLFLNLMQRRHLNRAVIGTTPEKHSGLGVDRYLTATSPIRKYSDLATQRQIKSLLGMEEADSEDGIREVLAALEQPLSAVGRIQFMRRRYWLLRYYEARSGQKVQAMVLDERRNQWQVILFDSMLEWMIPVVKGMKIKPESEVTLTVQHVNARKDQLSLYLS